MLRASGIKAVRIHGAISQESAREPALEIVWEPDLTKVVPENEQVLRAHINEQLVQAEKMRRHGSIGNLVRLLSHTSRCSQVLEIGDYEQDRTQVIMDSLDRNTMHRRFSSYNRGRVVDGLEFHEMQPHDFPGVDKVEGYLPRIYGKFEVMPLLSAAMASKNKESARKVCFKALANKLSQLTLTPVSDIAFQIAFFSSRDGLISHCGVQDFSLVFIL